MINIKTISVGMTLTMAATIPSWADVPSSFADLAEQVSPSVVRITTTTNVEQGQNGLFPQGTEIPDFMQRFFDQNPGFQGQSRPSQGIGSGFIIDGGDFVVTNNHVVDEADEIIVEMTDGTKLSAELVGKDARTDVAVLKITNDTKLPSVDFGDSDIARVGDWVMAVGSPLGQDFTVTTGIISARNRSLDGANGAYEDFLQTDAAINRGNSGGPLFNMEGDVVGMNTAILSPNGGSIGLGFAMSSNVISKIVDQIIEYGEARRGWLGVSIGELDEASAEAMGLNKAEGVLVQDVAPNGPAQAAGIRAGDVILNFNGEKIDDTKELVQVVGGSEIDKEVSVEIYRPKDNKNINVDVTLGKLPERDALVQASTPTPEGKTILGMTLIPLDQRKADELGIEVASGLLITDIDEESHAAERGLRAGDLIREVNQFPINSAQDLEVQIKTAKSIGRNSIFVLAESGGNTGFIALPIN